METYSVDVLYLQEEDSFVSSKLVPNWPAASNPFLRRSAADVAIGAKGSLGLEDFAQWVGELALQLPSHHGAALDLSIATGDSGTIVEYELAHYVADIDPPIEADNPGFVRYALNWFSTRRPAIRLFVTDGLFWVEGEK